MNVHEITNDMKQIVAIREAANATVVAQHGEAVAKLVDGYVKDAYDTGLIALMLEGAPPMVKIAVLDKFSELLSEISVRRGEQLGLEGDMIVTFVKQAQEVSSGMLAVVVQQAEENASKIVVPLH